MPRDTKNSKSVISLKEHEYLLERIASGSIPSVEPDAIDPSAIGAPREWHAMIRFLRTAPFVKYQACIGAGIGLREVGGKETDEVVVVALVRKKLPVSKLTRGQTIPESMVFDGTEIKVDIQEAGFDPYPEFMAAAAGAFPRATGSCSGSAISVQGGRDPCAGGTLTGIFGGRALTAAHVTLGFGIQAFMANLPASLLWLFESPDSTEMIASANIQRGQGLHQLFEVDTAWPILVPMPTPLLAAGVMGFLYVDGAAGDAQPVVTPPFARAGIGRPFSFAGTPPPLLPNRSNRFGGRIGSARIAFPGERCQKDGQTSGMTFGRVWMPFFQLYLPLPLGLVNTFVIFDTVLCRLVIGPGDSGAAVLSDDLRYLAQASIGFPIPSPSTPAPGNFICPIDGNDLIQYTLGTPHYLHELLLGVNLS